MILSIDGGKNIGWALFHENGEFVDKGVISHTEWFGSSGPYVDADYNREMRLYWPSDLEGYEITTLVVEGIRHNPNINQGGSQHWESQVEGAVRMLGALTGVPVIVQRPDRLPVAAKHAGYEMPKTKTGNKKHLPDEISAWLHGRYYLTSIGVLS